MSDYERIAEAIAYIAQRVDRQPDLREVADHLHLSPFHFQRLFRRWAGVSPKRFLQVLTLERAKRLLREAGPLLEVSDALGLSSGSRLYDHFVQLEAVTPGEYKAGGAGMIIGYGVHDTPFGEAFIATTPRGVCRLAFLDHGGRKAPLAALREEWPRARIEEAPAPTQRVIDALFGDPAGRDRPLSLHVAGTNFQVNVWRALLRIPPASVTTYRRVAEAIGRPAAARAVGRAVGANPVAFLIPCHRVILQNGGLAGYRWGEARKRMIHAWEAARDGAAGGDPDAPS